MRVFGKKKMLVSLLVLMIAVSLFTGCLFVGINGIGVAGKNTVTVNDSEKEFRAVWVPYYDFDDSKGLSKAEFSAYIDEMFDNIVSYGMNTVIVHVRAFSDAMYKSSYYPWSYYASGKQGKNPGYDPLKIMVEKAHERNLEIHAWLNPYRVTNSWNGGTDVTKLSKKSPARKWLTNKKTSDDRNVLSWDGALYYNPSISAVRTLIVNGVKEIVENYDVDGIHFDDYFYPAFGSNYENVFDSVEYEKYKKKRQNAGKNAMSIVEWRKNNVNTLVKEVYKAVKEINENVVFGISPGGYIDYFDEDKDRWYVDYKTWMSEEGYIDYICPQLYWSFNSRNIFPFNETLEKWCDAGKNEKVRVYAGLPAYKMNENNNISSLDKVTDTEWYNQYLLADMIHYIRRNERASGFIVFEYSSLTKAKNSEAVKNMTEEIEYGKDYCTDDETPGKSEEDILKETDPKENDPEDNLSEDNTPDNNETGKDNSEDEKDDPEEPYVYG